MTDPWQEQPHLGCGIAQQTVYLGLIPEPGRFESPTNKFVPRIGSRVAFEADREVGLDDGVDIGRPAPGAVTPAADDLAVGGVPIGYHFRGEDEVTPTGTTPRKEDQGVSATLKAMNVSRADLRLQYVDPGSVDAQRCLFAYASELAARFPEGYEASDLVSADDIRAHGACLVARFGDRPVGCGILRQLEGKTDEIKHLWVDPNMRGLGVASTLLKELERAALQRGNIRIRLDTHEVLTEAISLYRSVGYVEIPPYGSNPHAGVWFEKRLDSPT